MKTNKATKNVNIRVSFQIKLQERVYSQSKSTKYK